MQESIAAMVLVYIYLLFLLRTSTRIISITPGQSIKDSNADTLISANGIFQLGFFSPGNSASQYLGTWYNTKKVSIRTVVWVANRETPISGTSGALNITSEGILVLGSNTDSIFWSSNTSRTPQNPVAELLDSRNLVVRDGDENILWQSFDYPSDTLLPRMKLGNDSITSKDTLRCFHVGLLCVQQLPEDRPNMASVVLMLGSDGSLPQPKQPGFYTERNPFQIESSSHSVNQITSTSIEAR